jgi:hypothetical protein
MPTTVQARKSSDSRNSKDAKFIKSRKKLQQIILDKKAHNCPLLVQLDFVSPIAIGISECYVASPMDLLVLIPTIVSYRNIGILSEVTSSGNKTRSTVKF